MKKILMYILLACTLLMVSSCGSQNDLSTVNAADNTDEAAIAAAENSKQAFIEEVSKENYIEVTDDAAAALNFVSQVSKKIFIDADGKWMYGYKGKETVYNEESFVFSVYTQNDDCSDKVGVVAVTANNEKVYVFNEDRGCFEMADYSVDNAA